MEFYIGLVVTVLTVIFCVAPAVVGIVFDYTADTYMGQVKAGLGLMLVMAIIAAVGIAITITIGFLSGDYEIASKIADNIEL